MRTILLILIMSLVSCTSQTNNPTKIDNSLMKNETGLYICPPCNSSCDKLEFNAAGNCNQCGMELVLKDSLKEHIVPSRKKIAFYLQPGVEILDFAGPMEVFSSAGFEVFTVSKTTEAITTQGILKFIPDYSIINAPQSEILAFFGGGNASGVSKDPEIINWIQSRQDVEYYFSVCTGVFFLAEAGLLNGKTATTFHGAIKHLKKNYPEINVLENTRFVDNGKIITTAGVSAGIDGALHLVVKLLGLEKAKEVVTYMEYNKWVPNEGLILDNLIPSSTTNNNSDTSDYPPPGEMVDIGGYKLHLLVEGKGQKGPTIVFFHGAGDIALNWNLVLPQVGKFATAVAIDQSGEGWSEFGHGASLFQQVYDSRKALKVAGYEAPYILVGHSLGGILANIYAKEYPSEVAGVVMVDATHPDVLLNVFNKESNTFEWKVFRTTASDTIPSVVTTPLVNKPVIATFQPKKDFGEMLDKFSEYDNKLFNWIYNERPWPYVKEYSEGDENWTAEKRRIYSDSLQLDLLNLSNNSKQIIAVNSGHHIHIDEPQIVIDAVRQLVRKLKDANKK